VVGKRKKEEEHAAPCDGAGCGQGGEQGTMAAMGRKGEKEIEECERWRANWLVSWVTDAVLSGVGTALTALARLHSRVKVEK
jgi:hypothetical protein